jgi:hypothetical protein
MWPRDRIEGERIAAPRHRRERRPLLLDFEQDIAELPPTGGSYNISPDPPSDPVRR